MSWYPIPSAMPIPVSGIPLLEGIPIPMAVFLRRIEAAFRMFADVATLQQFGPGFKAGVSADVRLTDRAIGGRNALACVVGYASTLLSLNAPLLYVAEQLGHGSAAVTLKHYAKWLPKAKAGYVQLLDALCVRLCVSEPSGLTESLNFSVIKW